MVAFANFQKQIPQVKATFDHIFANVQNITQVANGFSYLIGDITLAKCLMKDILPPGFNDDSNRN